MTARRLVRVVAFAVVAASGCAIGYTGAARPIAATAVAAADGWVVAPVPEIRQVADNDCGPAALVMVAARWQRPIELAVATQASAPSAQGTRLGTLRDLARAHGLRAFTLVGDRALVGHELARGRPVIVGLVRPHGRLVQTHFEVVVGLHPDGRVVTVDPSAGWQVRPWAGLEAEWAPAGHAALVVLGPQPVGGGVSVAAGSSKKRTSSSSWAAASRRPSAISSLAQLPSNMR